MIEQPYILIEANDCCVFQNQEKHGDAIQYFVGKANTLNVFSFKTENNKDEIPMIAEFNYRDAKWYAGRLVGEADFEFDGNKYKIKVNPRFGEVQLFRMLEEVFNVRITDSNSLLKKQNNLQFLIKNLISFLWLNMLAKANNHGLPKHNISRTYIGSSIRGKLNVRQSIIPLYTEEKLISNYKEKANDHKIANLLLQAYEILLREFNLGTINAPANAKDAIEQIKSSNVKKEIITENTYRKIIYKDIYLPYKPVVDFSWDIIRKKSIGNQNTTENKKSFSFFIDMAEIWELYLKSILKKRLSKEGWILRKDDITTYKYKDFQRRIIPDIVFQKEDKLMVWDAKYKRMQFDYFDFDRADYFQIHTYINYYHQNKNVIAGGLLYPISKAFDTERQNRNKSQSLFSSEKTKTVYAVDGIDYTFSKDGELTLDKIQIEESNFANRIGSIIRSAE